MRIKKINLINTVIIMFAWLYDTLMSFVSFILGFLGIKLNKKNVHFAEDVENTENKTDVVEPVSNDTKESTPSE